jgi:hypothetical protein
MFNQKMPAAPLATPTLLWVFVWLFGIAVLGFLAYELNAAFQWPFPGYPTISALVIPNVRAHLGWAILIACLFLGFVLFLLIDWFQLVR